MSSDHAALPRFLTLRQVANELNVSLAQVYALVRDRSVKAVKIGGRGQWRAWSASGSRSTSNGSMRKQQIASRVISLTSQMRLAVLPTDMT